MTDHLDGKTVVVALITILILAVVVSTTGPPAPSTEAPRQPPPLYRPELDYLSNGGLAVRRIEQLAVETNGDFSRLSAEDQQWMDRMTLGHGAVMFRKRAEALKKQAEAKKRRKTSGKADQATPTR